MLNDISVINLSDFKYIIGSHCNPFLTISVSGTLSSGNLQFTATDICDGLPHERVLSTISYLKHLYSTLPSNNYTPDRKVDFIFQAEDVPVNISSASWETMKCWDSITLIPDLYYFIGGGYEDSFLDITNWNDRDLKIVWRGSTTGLFHQRLDDLDRLPRYRLCDSLSRLGNVADVGINAVVQALNDQQELSIQERLIHENLFKPFLPMGEMMRYRYILDIDGNSNSWNFMMKLRLGCCVLRVESEWKQWFAPRLQPWVHYVPISNDLSDVEERIEWCFTHEAECAAIAAQGVEFARSMRFKDEMAQAASRIYLT